jgi:hypothetical protein
MVSKHYTKEIEIKEKSKDNSYKILLKININAELMVLSTFQK